MTPAADPSSAAAGALDEIWPRLLSAARVLLPSTLLASLFYYFGLRYTDYHYREYGLDDAALGYSSVDYVVRSLNVTVQPARVIAIAALAAVAVHALVVAASNAINRRRRRLGDILIRSTGFALLAVGCLGLYCYWSPGRFARDAVAVSAGWVMSALCTAYGAYLAYVRVGPEIQRGRPIGPTLDRRDRRFVTSATVIALIVLIVYGGFELTRAYAKARAYQESRRVESTPQAFPLVHIYSTFDLALDDRLDVGETKLDGDQDDYRYRYDDLRLFTQDNGRLLLWPTRQSPRTGMFILNESENLRVEYQPDRRPRSLG